MMPEVSVPLRPTNSSRIVYSQNKNFGPRKHRGDRGSEQPQSSGKNKLPSQYSILKASQTSIGANSFARSAMRLKQKSSRNGMPNRGVSLDGYCSSSPNANAKSKADADFVLQERRTAGGAVWSRMLNMQSVEEGIQEGNISDEDD